MKDSEIEATPLCLRNISKGWTVDNMKKTGLNRYVFDFSVGVLVMMLCSWWFIRHSPLFNEKNDIVK